MCVMANTAWRFTDVPSLSRSSDISTAQLSEDVSSLLSWGRRILQQQREERRLPSHADRMPEREQPSTGAPANTANASVRYPLHTRTTSSTSAQAPSPVREAPRRPHESIEERGMALPVPSLHTQQSVQELRERLDELKALNEKNAHTSAQRLNLLRRGLERLARQHCPVEVARRERYVATLLGRAQAVVEGEEIICDALREAAACLAQYQRQQLQALTHASTSPLSISVDASREFTLTSEAKVCLAELVVAIKQRAQEVLQMFARLQDERNAKAKRRRAALQQRASKVEQLSVQLQALKSAVHQSLEKAKQQQDELAELQAQQLAREHAAALREAAARRRQALQDEHRRIARLQEEATVRNAVLRHEVAASEARCREMQVAYDMAARAHEREEDALRDARTAHRRAQQGRDEVDAMAAQLRRAVAAAEERCAELRAHRRACEDDREALLDAMQRSHHTRSSEENVGYNPAQRLVDLRHELPLLTEKRRHLDDAVTAAGEEHKALLDQLLESRAEVADLQARKAALEAFLVSDQPPRIAK